MSAGWCVPLKLSLLAAAIGMACWPQAGAAQRLSRAAGAIMEQAAAAQARFSNAQDADAKAEAIAAMERSMAECGRQRGCPMEQLVPLYRHMLQPPPPGT